MKKLNNLKIHSYQKWLAGILLAILALPAMAAANGANVSNPRIRMLPGDLPMAGYFELHNSGKKPITLTHASSKEFGMVMMHKSMHKNGEASMMMVNKIEIAPGKSVSFAPGGYHLMLMNRKKNLKVGDKVLIKLDFASGHSSNVEFKVGGVDTE